MNEIDEFLFLHLVEAIELCQCKGKQHFMYVISAPSSALSKVKIQSLSCIQG